jgi:hypothetical protein
MQILGIYKDTENFDEVQSGSVIQDRCNNPIDFTIKFQGPYGIVDAIFYKKVVSINN